MKWCVYGQVHWWGIGKVVSIQPEFIWIKYADLPGYAEEPWDPTCVMMFDTILDAMKEYAKGEGLKAAKDMAMERFPKEFK